MSLFFLFPPFLFRFLLFPLFLEACHLAHLGAEVARRRKVFKPLFNSTVFTTRLPTLLIMELEFYFVKFTARILDLDAGGKYIVVLNRKDAEDLGVRPLDRVIINYRKRTAVAIVNVSSTFVKEGEVLFFHEIAKNLNLVNGAKVDIRARGELISKRFIKRKIFGYRLTKGEIEQITRDVLENKLNDLEVAAFIAALAIRGLTIEEAVAFTKAFVRTGKTLNLKKKIILDKHSLGGVPGDKTTLVLVPIIASLGFTIPKTSSRAITSPAGTADRMEVLAPVDLTIEEVERVVRRTNGCIVWGGALNLAPVDDAFIKIEYPLELDPLYVPSIISKKKAVGATHLILDLPTGRGSKLPTFGAAYELAHELIEVAKRMKIMAKAALTYGEQPVGNAVGPALEAREALFALQTHRPIDLIDKATSLAGKLLELIRKGNREVALRALRKGRALKKFKEIIAAQGGDPNIKLEDIPVGEKRVSIYAEKKGMVMWIKNREIAEIAKIAGAPRDKGAGVVLHKKITDKVRRGEKLLTIYSNSSVRLRQALKHAEETKPIGIVDDLRRYMLITEVGLEPHERKFILER